MFGAPPVDGLGTAGGFKIMVEDRDDLGVHRAAKTPPTRWSNRATGSPA